MIWGIALTALLAVGAQAQEAARFEAEIQAFETADRAGPPPMDPVLFVGSSSIRLWTDLVAAFPSHSVLNRGFGGSGMSDLLYYFDRVVAVYRPALIVVGEEDGDLAGDKSVDQVYTQYVEFLARVKKQLPCAVVVFLAITANPSRVAYLEQIRQLNARLQALAADDPILQFIDVFTPMLDATGQPRAELFGSDLLHLNASGYALWQSVIGPALGAWSASKGQSFLFDFGAADTPTRHGPSPDDPVNYWNNVTETIGNSVTGVLWRAETIDGSATGMLQGIVNTRNKPTDIVLQMVNSFTGAGPARYGVDHTGPLGYGMAVLARFALNATKDSLYSTGPSNEAPGMFASFKLTGLKRERTYDFTFYAAACGFLDDRAGRPASVQATYTAVGANQASVLYDPVNNIDDKVATLVGIVPDALGQITISLAPTENNNRHDLFLGVLQVDEIPPPQDIVFVEEPVDQTIMEYRPAVFETAVTGTSPYTIQWLKNGRPIEGANGLTYTIPRATLDLEGAVLSVCISNAIDRAISRGAVLHVLPHFYGPVPLAAEASNDRTLHLSFDEFLDPNSVAPEGNYWINAGSVPVTSAVLEADGRTVTLALAAPLTDAFSVQISGVRDLAGNLVAAGTTIIGTLRSQAILIDFGASTTPTAQGAAPDDPDHFWNNVTEAIGTTAGGQVPNLVATDNTPTGISLVILSPFNGADTHGTLSCLRFPSDATRDSLFGNTEPFNGLSNVFPSFKLTGLDPLRTYDFTFYASYMGVSDDRETRYKVTGAGSTFGIVNAANNIDRALTLDGIVPTPAGEITIALSQGYNTSPSRFTYLGALRIESHGTP